MEFDNETLERLVVEAMEASRHNGYDVDDEEDVENIAVDIMDQDAEIEKFCKQNDVDSSIVAEIVKRWLLNK